VIHLAARVHQPRSAGDEDSFRAVNVEGTRALLEGSIRAGVRVFLFFSTVKVMGETTDAPWTEATVPAPAGPYGATKLEAERLVRELASQHGLHAPILRLPVTYGPGLADRVRVLARAGVDAATDLIGTDEAIDTSLELVPLRGRIVSIAAFGRGGDGIRLIGGGPGADSGDDIRRAARSMLTEAVADGMLRVIIERTYPLRQAAEAHRQLKAGHVTGKLVLTV